MFFMSIAISENGYHIQLIRFALRLVLHSERDGPILDAQNYL